MGKIGTILALIILLGLLVVLCNIVEVPYTAMVTYSIVKSSYEFEPFEDIETYTVEECQPIYGVGEPIYEEIPKGGGIGWILYPEVEIGKNCTNVTKYRTISKYRSVKKEKEVLENRPETFHRPLFAEWGLSNLLLETTTTIPFVVTTIPTATTTIPNKFIYFLSLSPVYCNGTRHIQLDIGNAGDIRIEKDEIKIYINNEYKGTFGSPIEPLGHDVIVVEGQLGVNNIKITSPSNGIGTSVTCASPGSY